LKIPERHEGSKNWENQRTKPIGHFPATNRQYHIYFHDISIKFQLWLILDPRLSYETAAENSLKKISHENPHDVPVSG